MGKNYNRFRRFCAFVLGAVFFVSGLLKLLDPVGAGLVVGEYFKFMKMDFMSFSSGVVGTFLAFTETFLGLALVTGLWRRAVAAVTMLFLAFFTVLTLILVIFNPSMDCGCFGEAIHLSHMESFIKNIVLCAIAAVAFFPLGKLGRPKRRKYVAFALSAIAVIVFSIYNILYIPVVDFTDFRAGAILEASVTNYSDMYRADFIYEKDGKQRRFCIESLPDSTWTFVRTETEAVGHSDDIIVQLPVSDISGEHHDGLAASGKVMAISVYRPYKMSGKRWHSVAELVSEAYKAGFTPLVLVSDDLGPVEEHLWNTIGHDDAAMIVENMYFSDYKTLITMNRSNGGATYFHDGHLVRKWAARRLPSPADMDSDSFVEATEASVSIATKGRLMFQSFLLYVSAVVLFI